MTQTPSLEPAVETALDHAPRRVVAAVLTTLALVLTALVTGAAAAAPGSRRHHLRRGLLHRQAELRPLLARRPPPDDAQQPGPGRPRAGAPDGRVEPALPQPHAHLGRHATGAGSARTSATARASASVHTAFMNSPAHKANILDRDYTEVGIGAVVANGRVWVAQVFRRPMRNAPPRRARTPRSRATPTSSPTAAPVPRSPGSRPASACARPASTAPPPARRSPGSRSRWAGAAAATSVRTTWSRLF